MTNIQKEEGKKEEILPKNSNVVIFGENLR